MTNTINQEQADIVEEFNVFDDWLDKYAYIIELGGKVPSMDDKDKIPEHIIAGCQSRVWLTCHMDGDKIIYNIDSDTLIIKGIANLLMRIWSGRTCQEVLNSEPTFIEDIGLRANLSPFRSNGLLALIKQMKAYALGYNSLNQKQ